MTKYAYCSFCERLCEWEKIPEGWRCTCCGAIRSTEPLWVSDHRKHRKIREMGGPQRPSTVKPRGLTANLNW